MSDVYVECLVQAKSSLVLKFVQMLLIVLAVILAFIGIYFYWFALLGATVAGGVAYYCYVNSNIEYEYMYLDREMTVDKVLAKSKRKRVAEFTVERMEIFAPIHSYHLDGYKNRNVEVKDFSAGEEQPDLRYVMYYEGGTKVILTPSEALVKALKSVAPRKVFTD